MRIAELTRIIDDFRAITARNSISPESLGYILQQIVNKVASVENQDEIYEIEALSQSLHQLAEDLTALTQRVPTLQTNENGTESNFIYSVNNKDSAACVLSSKHTGFVVQNTRLAFRRGVWTPNGNVYYTDYVPEASNTTTGVMSKALYAKLSALPTAEELVDSFALKVDAVQGQSLMTDQERQKLSALPTNAQLEERFNSHLHPIPMFIQTAAMPSGLNWVMYQSDYSAPVIPLRTDDVRFDPTKKRFYIISDYETMHGTTAAIFLNWPGCECFGTREDDGIKPHPFHLYFRYANNSLFYSKEDGTLLEINNP